MNRLQPLGLHQNQQNRQDDQGPFIENCVGISPSNLAKKKHRIWKFLLICFSISTSNKSRWSC